MQFFREEFGWLDLIVLFVESFWRPDFVETCRNLTSQLWKQRIMWSVPRKRSMCEVRFLTHWSMLCLFSCFWIYFSLFVARWIWFGSLVLCAVIFLATSASRPRADVAYCIHALARRIAKTHNWTVMSKRKSEQSSVRNIASADFVTFASLFTCFWSD